MNQENFVELFQYMQPVTVATVLIDLRMNGGDDPDLFLQCLLAIQEMDQTFWDRDDFRKYQQQIQVLNAQYELEKWGKNATN